MQVPASITASPKSDREYDLDGDTFHLLLATGGAGSASVPLTYHQSNRGASADPVDLTSVDPVKGASNALVKVHGALMILAWMAAASTGMMFARLML